MLDCLPKSMPTPAPAVSQNGITLRSELWREPTARGLAEATDNRDARQVNGEDEATDPPIARRVGWANRSRCSTRPRCCRRNEQRERSPTAV